MKKTILQQGFTLIELLLTLALFSFIVSGVVLLPPLFRESFNRQQVRLDVNSDGQWVMDLMLSDIRNSDKLASPQFQETTSELHLVVGPYAQEIIYRQNSNLLERCLNGDCQTILNNQKVKCEKFVVKDISDSSGRRIISIYLRLSHVYNSLGKSEYFYTQEFNGVAMRQQS